LKPGREAVEGASRRKIVVMSGLPASGKSTLGRVLARHLGFVYYDKDEFLEALFERDGCEDRATRRKLSRLADREFEQAARRASNAVLDSFWRPPPLVEANSGTPSDWIRAGGFTVVEVYVRCSPELAAKRFLDRARHPGHQDERWSYEALLAQAVKLNDAFPLGLGALVEVGGAETEDTQGLVARVEQQLEAGDLRVAAETRQLL